MSGDTVWMDACVRILGVTGVVLGVLLVGAILGRVALWFYRVTARPSKCIASGYRCEDERDVRCVAKHCTWHCSLYCGGACRKAWLERERARIARGLAVGAALEDGDVPQDPSMPRSPRDSTLKSTLPVRWAPRGHR